MGKKTIAFEQMFADYCREPWALSVSSCTAAIHLALLASKVKPGDEVITTPFTFAATVNAVEYTSLPRFCRYRSPDIQYLAGRDREEALEKDEGDPSRPFWRFAG